MRLQVAQLIEGTEQYAGDGVNGAMRCVVRLPDSNLFAAILKRGPIEEVFSESFCALLLRAWGLPVPDPYLIQEQSCVSFAGVDVGYPNLKQRLGINTAAVGPIHSALVARAIEIVVGFPTTKLAIACDEALDNRDRNLGNILWDGKSEVWIDHAHSLGYGLHFDDINKLCSMVIGTPHQDEIQRGAVSNALILDRSAPGEVDAVLAGSPLPGLSAAGFVADRLSSLGQRILQRFPTPNDLFSGSQQ